MELPPDPATGKAWPRLANGNLIAGAKLGKVLYEFTTAGVYVQKHDATGITGLNEISGLGIQPVVGLYPVTYWIADRGGSSGSAVFDGELYRVTFGAAPVIPPAAPVLTVIATPIGVNEGAVATFDADATDANLLDTLTFSLTGAPTGATINGTTGVFTWTPTEAQGPGTYPFTVVVSDQGMLSASQSVTINVAEVNSPPVVTNPGPLLRGEQETVDITMFGTDPDLPTQSKTWSATGLPPGLSINASTGHITGTVSAGATAGSPYSTTIRLTDNGAGALFDEETFSFSITEHQPARPGPECHLQQDDRPGHLAHLQSDCHRCRRGWSHLLSGEPALRRRDLQQREFQLDPKPGTGLLPGDSQGHRQRHPGA